MSAKASPLLKPEVAKDGVVRIPKTVFEKLPEPAVQPGSSKVRRTVLQWSRRHNRGGASAHARCARRTAVPA